MKFIQLVGAERTANQLRRYVAILSLIILVSLISACKNASPGTNPILPDSYPIDSAFQDFYDHLGGVQVLGPAISPLFVHDGINYQYTVSVLMVQDLNTSEDRRYSLAGLGLELGIAEPTVAAPPETQYYVKGHIIADPFVKMYEKIGGERFAGAPITEMHYNAEKRRFEQHFENVGMFLLEGDSEDEVGLQAYGAWKCNVSCRQPQLGASTVALVYRVDDVFHPIVEQLGIDFTGPAISGAYQTSEGDTEQVFDNIVLVAVKGDPSQVFLRDITRRIGMQPEPLSLPSQDSGMYFYPIDKERGLGYNVPMRFLVYLSQHGGREASGQPIGELKKVGETLFQQCFTNLCLEESLDSNGNNSVRPMRLGYTYKLWSVPPGTSGEFEFETPLPTFEPAHALPPAKNPEPELTATVTSLPSPPVQEPLSLPASELSIKVWESYPWVSPKQSQEIGVSVYANDVPFPGETLELIVILPDGSRKAYQMAPTDSEGQTKYLLDPIAAPNGTLIQYQACIRNSSGGKFCVKDNFLIWQNP